MEQQGRGTVRVAGLPAWAWAVLVWPLGIGWLLAGIELSDHVHHWTRQGWVPDYMSAIGLGPFALAWALGLVFAGRRSWLGAAVLVACGLLLAGIAYVVIGLCALTI